MTSTLKIYCTVEWLPTIPHFFLDQSHRVPTVSFFSNPPFHRFKCSML